MKEEQDVPPGPFRSRPQLIATSFGRENDIGTRLLSSFSGTVGATAVDDDDLVPKFVCLRDSIGDQRTLVPGRDDDTDREWRRKTSLHFCRSQLMTFCVTACRLHDLNPFWVVRFVPRNCRN